MLWQPERTRIFKHEYRRLSKEIQEKVNLAILELLTSKNPRKLGHSLSGKWEGCYSYEIDQKFRLIYFVRFGKKVVYFLSVGPHTIYR